MKTLTVVACLFLALFLQAARGAPFTGTSCTAQMSHGTYEWKFSEERILKTPEWKPELQRVPLTADQACVLARPWLDKHGFQEFSVEIVELIRYPTTSLGQRGELLKRRFYYKIHYTSNQGAMSSMYAFVLMDGTVLEPKISPAPPPEKKKPNVRPDRSLG